MKAYRVEGSFRMGRATTTFAQEVVGADEASARDRVLSTLGSRHRVNRREIKVTAVKALKAEDVTDPAVRHHLEQGA